MKEFAAESNSAPLVKLHNKIDTAPLKDMEKPEKLVILKSKEQ